MELGGQRQAPAALLPGKDPVPFVKALHIMICNNVIGYNHFASF
jgi:hypothetical protein